MKQRVFIKYLREEGHASTQIHSKSVEHYGDKALSYPDVSDWMRLFRMGREGIEDSRRSGSSPDLQTRLRIEGVLEASPNASVQDIVQTTAITSSTVFYVLTQVLQLEFCTWRWVPIN
jgi:hypothetical protein